MTQRPALSITSPVATARPSAPALAGFRPALLAGAVHLALAGGTLLLWLPPAHAQSATPAGAQAGAATHSYSIPAGPLGAALMRFAEASGVLLTSSPELVQGKHSPGVQGTLDVPAALRQLLAGTGLQAQRNGQGQYVLQVAPPSAQPVGAGGAVMLAPVTVVADADRGGVTEGTGSYTTNAVTIGKGDVKSLREIPQSVSVITHQQILDQGLTTLEGALEQTPGLYADGTDGNNGGEQVVAYRARGFSMGYSVDGMTSTNTTLQSAGQLADLSIVDRVEVLRGPAALLRGSEAGNLGGSVNLVRKRPLPEFGVRAELSAGSWNNYRGMVDLTGSLNANQTVRGRAVLVTNDRDYFYGPKSHGRNWTGYGIVELDLTPQTTWTLSGSHTQSRLDQPYTGVPRYAVDRLVTTDRSFNQNREQGYSDVDDTTVSTELTHRLDNDWKVSAKLNHQKYERQSDGFFALGQGWVNESTNLMPNLWRLRQDYDSKTLSYDINIAGNFDLFGRTHKLALGLDGSRLNYQLGTSTAGYSNLVNVFDTAQQFPDLKKTTSPRDRTHSQHAFYGTAQFKLIDPLTLILGARSSNYSYKERRITISDWATTMEKKNEVTPYGGLIWDVSNQISLYASYTDLFIPQSQIQFDGDTLPPRVGWQGEIGTKGEFFDGRLNGSIAFFRVRDTNRPIVDPDPSHIGCGTSATASCYVAAGSAQSQGIDMEISGSPLRGLQMSAGYTYNENKYLKDTNAANVGKKVDTLTPRHMLKVWGMYRFAANDLDGALAGWRIGAGFVAQSDTYANWGTSSAGSTHGTNKFSIPGRVIANAHIGWQVTSKTSVDLNINNLFDKRYLAASYGNFNLYGEPRNFTLTLRHQL